MTALNTDTEFLYPPNTIPRNTSSSQNGQNMAIIKSITGNGISMIVSLIASTVFSTNSMEIALIADDSGNEMPIHQGETVLLPATVKSLRIVPEGKLKMLTSCIK